MYRSAFATFQSWLEGLRGNVGEACFSQPRLHAFRRPKLEEIGSVRQTNIQAAASANCLIDKIKADAGASHTLIAARPPGRRTRRHFT